MSAGWQGRPALQLAHACHPLSWRPHDLARESRHRRWDGDALATFQAPRTDAALDVPVAISPGVKFLRNPGRQPGRRIIQATGQRLRLGALDPLVASLFSPESLNLLEKRLRRRREIGAFTRV